MTVRVTFKAVRPKRGLFTNAAKTILNKVDNAVGDFADDELTDDFNETQKTFRRKFDVETKDTSSRSQISYEALIEHEIYFFVSGGTRVRYATMSPDWRSKTQPGRLAAGAGRGRVLFVSRRRPRPGIEARNFDDQIVEKEDKPFERAVQEAIDAGVKVVF